MTLEFSHIVDLPKAAKAGKVITLAADKSQRAAIAARLNVLEITSFSAELNIVKAKSGVYTVNGEIKAELTQACVRTLAPVLEAIQDSFEVTVMAEELFNQRDVDEEEGDIEDIEILGDGNVDLGEIAVQYLSLALSPYPVSEGEIDEGGLSENVAILSEDAAREKASPFAVLKKNPKK